MNGAIEKSILTSQVHRRVSASPLLNCMAVVSTFIGAHRTTRPLVEDEEATATIVCILSLNRQNWFFSYQATASKRHKPTFIISTEGSNKCPCCFSPKCFLIYCWLRLLAAIFEYLFSFRVPLWAYLTCRCKEHICVFQCLFVVCSRLNDWNLILQNCWRRVCYFSWKTNGQRLLQRHS